MLKPYLQQNRLLERGGVAKPLSFKIDERFDAVLALLLRSGYSNTAEVLFDSVYRLANNLNESLGLPVLSDVQDRENELHRQLNALKDTQAKGLGALRR